MLRARLYRLARPRPCRILARSKAYPVVYHLDDRAAAVRSRSHRDCSGARVLQRIDDGFQYDALDREDRPRRQVIDWRQFGDLPDEVYL
jgi:hypothetical protein